MAQYRYWVVETKDGDEKLVKVYARKNAAEKFKDSLESYKESIMKYNPPEKWNGLDKTTYRVWEEEI